MIEIDKDKFKTYLNTEYAEVIRVDDIKSISVNSMRYYKDQLHKDSTYHDVIEKNGFVDLLMIKPIWNGWKIVADREQDPQYVKILVLGVIGVIEQVIGLI